MRQKAPAGFGGRLRGKGRNSQHVNPGPRRAAHPVHTNPATTHEYLEADLDTKQAVLQKLTDPGCLTGSGRYRPGDRILAFLDGL